MRHLLLAALLAVPAAGASATEESDFVLDTTADLADLCATPTDSPLYAAAIHMCQGYIMGVHHFHTALALELGDDIYCPPPPEQAQTRNEIANAFVEWVADKPEIQSREALDGLLSWATAAYPCPTSN